MWKLAFRNVFRHRGRTLLTLSAIILGVGALILSGGFVEDIFVQLREATIHSRLGHIQVSRSGYRNLGRRDPYRYVIEDSSGVVAALRPLAGVSDVLRRLVFTGMASTGRADLSVIGEGVEPDKESKLGTFLSIVSGRQLKDSDPFGILVGEGVAQALGVGAGDFMTLLATTRDGALNTREFEVTGVFRTFAKEYDARAIRIPLKAAQELTGTSGAHVLVFSLEETSATEKVAERLRRELARDGFEIATWKELADFYRKTVDLYRRQFGVLQVIIMVMIVLSVANSVNMAIFERTGEFGTLMALGDSKSRVFRLVTYESVVLGLVGTMAGAGMAVVLGWGISSIGIPMPPPPNANSGYTAYIRVSPLMVAGSCLVGLVATVLAGAWGAHRAARMNIVYALRQNI